jgi:hypothetical protein
MGFRIAFGVLVAIAAAAAFGLLLTWPDRLPMPEASSIIHRYAPSGVLLKFGVREKGQAENWVPAPRPPLLAGRP